VLRESGWISPEVERRLAREHAGWNRDGGACPPCIQQTLLETLLEKGELAFHDSIQRVWPLDAEAAFGAVPTPLRLHADPRFTGRGVTLALVDSAFYPHTDLVARRNRIRVWVDASRHPVRARRFQAHESPQWPGWDAASSLQWHGLMTTSVAAGDGSASHGLYRGMAPEAELVLVQVAGENGRIDNVAIARALRWIYRFGPDFGVRIVNLSLGGDPVSPLAGNPVDEAVGTLVAQGVTVVVAAGNDGKRHLVPPGTAPSAITVGGLDDRNEISQHERALWHSNYGETVHGALKPELVAPSLRVVAPVLPGSEVAREADALFAQRAKSIGAVEARLAELKLVTPYYQHVEGTSFASPVVAGVVACMIEANPGLTPRRVRELLMRAAHTVPGASPERQGAGALDAGRSVTAALSDVHGSEADYLRSPLVKGQGLAFLLHDHAAREVAVVGSWNDWRRPGVAARPLEKGLWEAHLERRPEGRHQYKFLIDGDRWLADPANPAQAHDGHGGLNSVLLPP
jgi:serine protease AprX